jgi:hypothetical protein
MTLEIKTVTGVKLDTQNAAVNMVLNSAMFTESLAGSFSYPFTMPASAVNQSEFGFLENSNVKSDRHKAHNIIIENDGLAILKGRLKVRESYPRFYDCDITVPYANVSPEFWDKPMNTHDWGGEILPTVTKSQNIFTGEIPTDEIPYYGLKSTVGKLNLYEIVVDGTVLLSFENAIGIDPEANLKTRLEEIIGSFNAQYTPYFNLAVIDNSLQIMSVDTIFDVVFRASINNFTGRILTTTLTKIADYQEPPDSYFRELASTNFAAKPWRLAAMHVADGKIANVFEDFGIEFTEYPAIRRALCPVPTLKMLIDGIAKAIDYTPHGDFYEDPDLQELCFYSGYVLDKQLEGVAMPFLVLNQDFQYAKMMPSYSFRKFLNQLRNTFNLVVTFDHFQRKMVIKKADIVALSVPTADFSDKANPNYRTLDSDNRKTNLLLRWKIDANDPAAKPTEEKPIPVFDSYPYSEDGNGFDAIESELQPIFERVTTTVHGLDLTMFVGGVLPYYSPPVSGELFKVTSYNTLVCEKPLYNNIKDIDTAPRMFFYKQNLEGSTERGFYALHWDKLIANTGTLRLATGIYTSFWQHTKSLLSEVFEIETDIAFTAADISNIDLTKKIMLWGGTYLIKQIDVEFPIRKPSKTRLWRC